MVELFFYYCTQPARTFRICWLLLPAISPDLGLCLLVERTRGSQIFMLEYPVRCSPSILYEFLSTPAGLQEWFADKVDERDNVFSFSWNGTTDRAEVMESESEKFIRFHWMHAPKEEYFEFRIEKSEVTNQTILVIRDFAGKGEIKDQSQLWSYQVKDLFHRLGN